MHFQVTALSRTGLQFHWSTTPAQAGEPVRTHDRFHSLSMSNSRLLNCI